MSDNNSGVFSYPLARRDETLVEEIHGHKVKDKKLCTIFLT